MIPINIACEDVLSEAIIDRILTFSSKNYLRGLSLRKNGQAYLKNRVIGLNNAAKGMPYLILTDLDRIECPPVLINDWLGNNARHPNLIFRIAVEEIESWLLADKNNFAIFLGIPVNTIPNNADSIRNPKEYIVQISQNSNKRDIRQSLIPKPNSTSRVGPNYNGKLIEFTNSTWAINEAVKRSNSLSRMVNSLNSFSPIFPQN